MTSIVVETATVGYILNTLSAQAERLIDEARRAGRDVIQLGGNEVRNTIRSAQIVYSERLQETVERVGDAVANALRQIENSVLEVERNVNRDAQALMRQGTAVANTLPLSDAHHPQLVQVSPCTFFRRGDNPADIMFTCTGNFYDAATPNYTPTISYDNRQPVINTTTDLGFRIPFTTVFPVNATNSIIYSTVTLTVPWIKQGIINTNQVSTFRFELGAFPQSPGTIQLKYYTDVHRTQNQWQFKKISSQRGEEHTVHGDQYTGGNNDKIDKEFIGRATPGWTVVANTHSYEKEGRFVGDHTKPEFVLENATEVKYKGTTIHKSLGSSGLMEFHIGFTEEKYELSELHTENIPLTWGQNHLIPVCKVRNPTLHNLANTWKITFIPFDNNGVPIDYNGQATHRYLRIDASPGGGYTVTATLPSTIH